MAKWKISDKDKAQLKNLASEIDENKKKTLNNLTNKEKLDIKDIKELKNIIPPNIPVFAIFNKLTVSMDEPGAEYKASTEFRAKTEVLRQIQDNMAYKRMVESVDPAQKYGQVYQLFIVLVCLANRQLMSIVNVVITVVGAFFFGFTGVTYAYPHLNLDLATRFLIGLVLATIVFFADLYFVIKSMEEEVPDKDKSPFANSHNLNFREVTRSNGTEAKTTKIKEKSKAEKKND